MKATERIVCAALRKHGDVLTGPYHGAIFGQRPIGELRDAEQGFVTNAGRFVDRSEGLAIARRADQIGVKHPPIDILLSEDLKK